MTRLFSTNIRLKPILRPKMVSRRRSYRSNEHIPIPLVLPTFFLTTQSQNPQHSITPRRRENNHPDNPLPSTSFFSFKISTRILHNPPKHPLEIPPHPGLIHNQLLNPNPLPNGQNTAFVHERLGYDIAALFADQKEEGEFPRPSPHPSPVCPLLETMATIIMVQDIPRQVLAITRLRAVDGGVREVGVDQRR